MRIDYAELFVVKFFFKEKFVHAKKSRINTKNVILKLISGSIVGVAESIPRDYVTGEDVNSVLKILKFKFLPLLQKFNFTKKEEIFIFLESIIPKVKKEELSAFGIFEDALINLSAQIFNYKIKDIFSYLKLKVDLKHFVNYSAIIGENSLVIQILKALYVRKNGFKQVKIKVSPKSLWHIGFLKKILKDSEIRLDANMSFNSSNYLYLIRTMNKYNITLIEQPFKIDNYDSSLYLSFQSSGIKIVLDEDFCTLSDLNKFYGNSKIGDIADLRIGKNGGIFYSLVLYKKLTELKIDCILGCMVGETILTRENFEFAKYLDFIAIEGDYDRFLFDTPFVLNPSFGKNGKFNLLCFDINSPIVLHFTIPEDKILSQEKLLLN